MTGARPLSLREWLQILFDDGLILLSWFVLVGFGIYGIYSLSGGFGARATPYSTFQIWQGALAAGYWGWAMYWGIPGCLGFLRRRLNQVFTYGFSLATLIALLFFLIFAALVICYYPPFGGGIYHFLQRWRNIAALRAAVPLPPPSHVAPHPYVQPSAYAQPPTYAPPPPGYHLPPAYTPPPTAVASSVEQRLRDLADLLRRGVISQQEHDQQRMNVLRGV